MVFEVEFFLVFLSGLLVKLAEHFPKSSLCIVSPWHEMWILMWSNIL